jgi:uncharacterized protein (UPF0332 family)
MSKEKEKELQYNIDLSKARLSLAKERLMYADKILEIGDYKTVANRSYYAVFSAMRAVLALDNFDSKKHSGVISEFRRKYIKTEVFPIELSDTITELEYVRQNSDYDDFYVISKQKVSQQLDLAKEFVTVIEKHLTNLYNNEPS